ncbi:MAG TPA: glutathione S-transferase [Burkholderiaceae bacterium]|nr:glutathione S-transferase [Burkholderiaceae bacterium]
MTTPELVFHHCPNTRSSGVLVLLEELGAPYTLKLLNMKAGEQRSPAYLKINPMGKVPAVSHGDAVVTEQVAVYLYVADLFPQAGITPAIGDPLRGPYLRWTAFYGSSFEPALVDRSQKHVTPPVLAPYGDYDTTLKTLNDQLARGPWLLGERFTAADVLWGTALGWTVKFGLVPNSPEVERYLARFNARPAVARARAKDAEFAKRLA